MKRFATSVWNGTGKDGNGHLTTQSATLNHTAYSFNTRFGDGKGTNPEELIAAAHAGCFNMALSFALSAAGFRPESLTTVATLTMEQQEGGFTITAMYLDLKANVPEIDPEKFAEIASGTKENCPVSKVLNAEISLHAVLVD